MFQKRKPKPRVRLIEVPGVYFRSLLKTRDYSVEMESDGCKYTLAMGGVLFGHALTNGKFLLNTFFRDLPAVESERPGGSEIPGAPNPVTTTNQPIQ